MVGVKRGGGREEDGRVYRGVVWTSDLCVVCGTIFNSFFTYIFFLYWETKKMSDIVVW
jgi:hypothetical protein